MNDPDSVDSFFSLFDDLINDDPHQLLDELMAGG